MCCGAHAVQVAVWQCDHIERLGCDPPLWAAVFDGSYSAPLYSLFVVRLRTLLVTPVTARASTSSGCCLFGFLGY